MSSSFIFVCVGVILSSLVMCSNRLLNSLIVLENMNVLILFYCLVNQSEEFRMVFMSLMVIFTIEITLALVALTRVWNWSVLIDTIGW